MRRTTVGWPATGLVLAVVLLWQGCGDGETSDDGGTTGRDARVDAPDGAGGGRDGGPEGGSDGAPGREAGAADGGSPDGAGPTLPRHNADSPLGTNLFGMADWAPVWPFVDVFRMSRPWISGTRSTWDDGRDIDLDENGWVRSLQPGQIVHTLMLWGDDVPYPAGRYTVLYEGSGRLEYFGGARRIDDESAPGREVVRFDPAAGGFGMNLVETDPSDHLRNIRVIMPGGVCEADPYRYCDDERPCGDAGRCVPFTENAETQRFHPQFLDSIKTYRLLRFMNWMRTNDSTVSSWAERPKLSDARWTLRGVPLEVMVDLANRLGAEPWFCIPHRADEDYVRNFAIYVRDRLDPSLRAWVEHSNEVWNSIFEQSGYAQEQGLADGLSDNPYQAQIFWHSRRSVRIFTIFEEVFGGTARLVRVMGSQAANPWVSRQVLSFEGAASQTDALAIAPYFGGYLGVGEQARATRAMSLDELFATLRDEAVPRALAWMADQKAVADEFGVRLVAYEAGQHLVGVGPAQNDMQLEALFTMANRDPRMGELYATYLQGWRAAGGELLAHYTHTGGCSRYGCWGSLEHLAQPRPEAPKFDALQSFIETTSPWW